MKRCLHLLLLSSALAACGSPEVQPTPLTHTFDDFHLAPVPISEKGLVIQAKQDYDIALMEKAKAEADINDIETKLQIARNETEQMALAERSARTEKSAADKSADMTRVNNAARELRSAELGRRAADAKVAFLSAKLTWARRHHRYTRFNEYAKEGKYVLEKARVAKTKNIRPAGFNMANYENQYRDKSELAQRARLDAQRHKDVAEAKRKEWNAKEKEYLTAKGVPSAGEAGTAGEGTSTSTPEPTTTSTDNAEPLR